MIRTSHCVAGFAACDARRRASAWRQALVLLVAAAVPGCATLHGGHAAAPAQPVAETKSAHGGDRPPALREQLALEPAQPYWPYRLAQIQCAADSLPEAEAMLHEALHRDPNYAPALSMLAKLYFDHGRYEEGVQLLEPVRQHPDAFAADDRAALLAGLALHEESLGRSESARGILTGIGQRDLGHTGSAMVYVLLHGDKPDSAGDLAAKTLNDGPSSAINLNNYGIARLRAGDVEAARRAFMSAIERDPTLPGPYYNLAILGKFYRFDDAGAADAFRRYWSRSHADPDSLAAGFGALTKNVSGKEN